VIKLRRTRLKFLEDLFFFQLWVMTSTDKYLTEGHVACVSETLSHPEILSSRRYCRYRDADDSVPLCNDVN